MWRSLFLSSSNGWSQLLKGKHTIVIVGFMGSGKTTVGNELARRLACRAVDLDSWITERERRSPTEIIEQDGETAFRRIETEALLEVLREAFGSSATVVAVGAAPGLFRRIGN